MKTRKDLEAESLELKAAILTLLAKLSVDNHLLLVKKMLKKVNYAEEMRIEHKVRKLNTIYTVLTQAWNER